MLAGKIAYFRGSAFPAAIARDAGNNVIAATDYTDGNGLAWRAHVFNSSGTLTFSLTSHAAVRR
jgi:hypothetical protein